MYRTADCIPISRGTTVHSSIYLLDTDLTFFDSNRRRESNHAGAGGGGAGSLGGGAVPGAGGALEAPGGADAVACPYPP